MKTAKDPRHVRRIRAVKSLFAQSFTKQEELSQLAKEVIKVEKAIDEKITKAAPQWPVDKLNRVDLAVLRLAVYEITFSKTPPKVVIDEAVELAKRFGSDNSSSFVNGVLGTIYKGIEEIENKP